MSDLIDREALLKRMNRRLDILRKECGLYDHFTDGYDEAIDHVMDFPAVEAEPVRHAKVLYNVAIEKEECNGYKKRKGLVLQKYTCASCYEAIHEESKFCMECGAKLIWRNEDD